VFLLYFKYLTGNVDYLWKRHSDVLAMKFIQGAGVFRHFKNVLPPQILLLLYNALVHTYI
jgi:hypothetical protein